MPLFMFREALLCGEDGAVGGVVLFGIGVKRLEILDCKKVCLKESSDREHF